MAVTAFPPVADVAVEMGPRNERRLITGGIALAVIAALVLGAMRLTRSTSTPGAGLSARSAHSSPLTLVFGATPKHILHVAGRPTTIEGRCWIYRPKAGMEGGLPTSTVGSISLGQPGSIAARTANGLKLCFFGGTFSDAFIHSRVSSEGYRWSSFDPSLRP